MAKGDLKGDIINAAYEELRISGLTVNPTPEDLELALSRLENMMTMLKGRNICTGYSFEDEPDPNSLHNVGRKFWYGIGVNLALRLQIPFNKQISQELRIQANAEMSNMSGRTALTRQVNYPDRQPRGAGNTLRWGRWARFYHPQPGAPLECATVTIALDDINDFTEHFDAYLRDAEVVQSYTISADTGLSIISDSLSSPDVLYRIQAVGNADATTNVFQQVTIIATTSTGRVETRRINFEIVGVE